MGYAYEKSGSLLRSIFIHLLFNGLTIAFALLN
jgi:membrane protease YdiL (CAAX protease family)